MRRMFTALRKIALKLALLAGIPLIGALLLAVEIQRSARDRSHVAEAIGSVEDLAELSARMAATVEQLQSERARAALSLGLRSPTTAHPLARDGAEEALALQQAKTDAAARAMTSFLAQRDLQRLPPQLRGDLARAEAVLSQVGSERQGIQHGTVSIADLLEYYGSANDALIDATADLTHLSNDGELLRAISSLVAVMQVQECESREHAVLSHTFAAEEFAPGMFRYLVTLVTEQAVQVAVLGTFGSDEQADSYQRTLALAGSVESQAMLKRALAATDEQFDVDVNVWFETQQTKVHTVAALAAEHAKSVRQIAHRKIEETRRAVRYGESLAVGVVVIAVLLTIVIGRDITGSVLGLARLAGRVQREKDFSLRAVKTSGDELGTLTDAFNEMLSGIESRDRALHRHREGLEQTIAERTLTLWTRTEQMRLILDTVEQGLATLDTRGRICAERSQAFDVFFPGGEGEPYFKHIAGHDARLALALELDWEQITEGVFPLEVAVAQAKRRIQIGESHFSICYEPILDGEELKGALLTVANVTSERVALRVATAQREQINTFARVIRDRSGFLDFFRETQLSIESIGANQFASTADRLRTIHTLKGNAALSDVTSVASAANALEQAIADGEPGSVEVATRALAATWDAFAQGVLPILGPNLGERYKVNDAELDEILRAVRDGRRSDAERLLAHIRGETTGTHFQRVAEQLKGLAGRLGKGEPEVLMSGTEIRLPHRRFAPFWSALAHVVSNVADHGLESPAERALAGKSGRNRVQLSARVDADSVTIEISDDGRGIDWQKVAARANARGWPHQTRAELSTALFAPGFSTVDSATEVSGRGVGMSAVLEACRALDGECFLDSEVGQGTKLTFRLALREALSAPHPAGVGASRTSAPPPSA